MFSGLRWDWVEENQKGAMTALNVCPNLCYLKASDKNPNFVPLTDLLFFCFAAQKFIHQEKKWKKNQNYIV